MRRREAARDSGRAVQANKAGGIRAEFSPRIAKRADARPIDPATDIAAARNYRKPLERRGSARKNIFREAQVPIRAADCFGRPFFIRFFYHLRLHATILYWKTIQAGWLTLTIRRIASVYWTDDRKQSTGTSSTRREAV